MHNFDGGRVGVGVVGTELFDETTVALGAGISSYEVVEGFAFLTVTLESEAYSHGIKRFKRVRNPVVRTKIGAQKYVAIGDSPNLSRNLGR